jgi:simple sugar transport system substrate-binding protein
MIDLSKRNTLRLAAASAAAATLPAWAADDKPLKVGWIYVGPVGDGGWTFAHDNGRKAVEKKFGDRVQTVFVENVPEGPDTERVARDLVSQGCGLIFGTSFGFMNPMLKVAKDHPNVKFEHCTGYKTAKNLRTYEARNYEGAYLSGLIAGALSQTGKMGHVATVPIPEVLRNLNSFALGARAVNPKASLQVVWLNEWHNPPKEVEAATSLINAGADVLFQNTDSSAVLNTAESRGKHAFGWNAPMSHYGPKAHLGSSIIDWAPYYTHAVEQALDGSWAVGPNQWWGVKEGAIDLVDVPDSVPADVRERMEKAKAGLKDGSFAIWTGPIKDNTGKEVLADGKVADDDFLKAIQFYVEGVEGKVPGAK